MSSNRPFLIAALALLAGCATTDPIGSGCDWTQPIQPSQGDILTDGTVEQILAHNEIGARMCGWKA